MPTFTTPSIRWQILSSVANLLETATALQGVRLRVNPRQAVKVGKPDYMIVIRWDVDTLVESKGQKEIRKFRLLVGSIANTEDSDGDADAMHVVVGGLVRSHWKELSVFANKIKPQEIEVVPDVDQILIEGALVASAWDIEYEKVHPLP